MSFNTQLKFHSKPEFHRRDHLTQTPKSALYIMLCIEFHAFENNATLRHMMMEIKEPQVIRGFVLTSTNQLTLVKHVSFLFSVPFFSPLVSKHILPQDYEFYLDLLKNVGLKILSGFSVFINISKYKSMYLHKCL